MTHLNTRNLACFRRLNSTRFLRAVACGMVLCGMNLCGMSLFETASCATAIQDKQDETGTPKLSEFTAPKLAWEYNPYLVKIWICHEQSSFINSSFERIKKDLETECILIDASGWQVTVENSPLPWNWRILQSENLSLLTESLVDLPEVTPFDKLICIRVKTELGRFHYDVQELDIKTRQWGARNIRMVGNREALVKSFASAIARAFMPLARIDKVIDKKVKLRVRASGLVKSFEYNEEGVFTLITNASSPVSVSASDAFMPVVRRLDRDGHFEGIDRIAWTFLTVTKMGNPLIECTTYARGRAPLSGRVGRRKQRYALVIRAPNRPTVLKLTSQVKLGDNLNAKPRPLPGLTITARYPGSGVEIPPEVIGMTDWRGQITIPPNGDSLRLLLVKSGRRRLALLPVVPGLFDEMVSAMPSDEKRLYAEGIYVGMQNELFDLVARRHVIKALAEKRLDDGDFGQVREIISELRRIDTSLEFNSRLSNELKRLQSEDQRQATKIARMFGELQSLAGEELTSTLEVLLSKQLAVAREGGDWRKVSLDGVIVDKSQVDVGDTGEDTDDAFTQ